MYTDPDDSGRTCNIDDGDESCVITDADFKTNPEPADEAVLAIIQVTIKVTVIRSTVGTSSNHR